ILDAPVRIHFPGLNRIEVAGNRSRLDEKVRLDFPEFRQLNDRRLPLAYFIRAAGLKDGFLAIPIPAKSESHVRLRIDRTLNFRLAPRLAIVRRNFDRLDNSSAGPRQAANFIEAGTIQFLSARGTGNDGPSTHLKLKPAREAVGPQARVLRALPHSHVGLFDELDLAQPFDVIDAFPAGNEEPDRIALLRSQRLAILAVRDQDVIHRFFDRDALGVFP